MNESLMIDKLRKAKDSLEKYKDSIVFNELSRTIEFNDNDIKSEELLDDAYNLLIQTIEHYDKILTQYYKYY
jgi:hypothetical protein|tara:strand:- start:684 stop:899 length:216 start_codon:yes stop_codon:yes gene_type:complete